MHTSTPPKPLACAVLLAASALPQAAAEDLDVTSLDSVALYRACAEALKNDEIEEAGFLFYAAWIRARVDLQVYSPTGKGGDSPATLIGALRFQIGQVLNPKLRRNRDVFTAVVDRLSKWNPVYRERYQPGWDYDSKPTAMSFQKALADERNAVIPRLEEEVKLFSDDEYYALFRRVQDFNFQGFDHLGSADSGKQPEVVTEAEFERAIARLKEIETEREVRFGLFTRGPEQATRKSLYSVRAGRVYYRNKALEDADAGTFESLSEVDYGRDAQRVFVLGHVIEGADPTSFRVIQDAYSRDDARFYCGTVRMEVANPDSFEVVHSSGSWSTVFSIRSFLFSYGDAFSDLEVGPTNPVVVGNVWARDGAHYYFGPAKVEGADYETFEVIDSYTGRDAQHEYQGSFRVDDLEERRRKYPVFD